MKTAIVMSNAKDRDKGLASWARISARLVQSFLICIVILALVVLVVAVAVAVAMAAVVMPAAAKCSNGVEDCMLAEARPEGCNIPIPSEPPQEVGKRVQERRQDD